MLPAKGAAKFNHLLQPKAILLHHSVKVPWGDLIAGLERLKFNC
jgi:hypothetical protein